MAARSGSTRTFLSDPGNRTGQNFGLLVEGGPASPLGLFGVTSRKLYPQPRAASLYCSMAITIGYFPRRMTWRV